MKRITMAVLAMCSLLSARAPAVQAQDAEEEVLRVVSALFDAMRAADSAAVRKLFHPELGMMASSASRGGVAGVVFGNMERFMDAVGGAEPGAFDERIGAPDMRIDDNLATVVTPYAFYHNGNLSHCGVNVFQIARVGDEWKIVGLADTRRRQGCEEWLK
jgi:hypothetical protein